MAASLARRQGGLPALSPPRVVWALVMCQCWWREVSPWRTRSARALVRKEEETRGGCHLEKQRGCSSRISPYLKLGMTRFSICARDSSVNLETIARQPVLNAWGVHSKGRAADFCSQKVQREVSAGSLVMPISAGSRIVFGGRIYFLTLFRRGWLPPCFEPGGFRSGWV